MRRTRFWAMMIWLLAALLTAANGKAQIVVIGGSVPNRFTYSNADFPVSGPVNAGYDVYVAGELELGGALFLENQIVMRRYPSPADTDQHIYFADDSDRYNEELKWDDSEDAFRLTNDLILARDSAAGTQRLESWGELDLFAEHPSMLFVVDSDNDQAIGDLSHRFTWSNDSTADANRVMVLESSAADDGDLFIDGQLTANHSFDLAESFWESEPLEPGELVSIDPQRGDAVRRSSGAYDRLVLGVVSTRPAMVMGGFAFSVEDLRRAWGDEVADALEAERPALEALVYGERPGLRAELGRLSSEAAYGEYLAQRRAEREPEPVATGEDREDGPVVLERGKPSERELAEQYRHALLDHEMRVEDLVMRRFFGERFADVAVAGRVPVKADASFGAIRPGDPLTSSPVPGVAMRATGAGPIIGTALEGLRAGSGRIRMLVHRGWHGGEGLDLAGGGEVVDPLLEAKNAEIEGLRKRLADLEILVDRLTSRQSVAAIAD